MSYVSHVFISYPIAKSIALFILITGQYGSNPSGWIAKRLYYHMKIHNYNEKQFVTMK